jgi:hypothetical protein
MMLGAGLPGGTSVPRVHVAVVPKKGTGLDPGRRQIIRIKPKNLRPASTTELTGELADLVSEAYDPSIDTPAHLEAFWKHINSRPPPGVLADEDHGTRDEDAARGGGDNQPPMKRRRTRGPRTSASCPERTFSDSDERAFSSDSDEPELNQVFWSESTGFLEFEDQEEPADQAPPALATAAAAAATMGRLDAAGEDGGGGPAV